MWDCPECGRRFGRAHQQHECAPALTLEEYFESGPDFERSVFEAIHAHLLALGPDIHIEPVSVGIFVKRRTTFLQLRTMTRWVAIGFSLRRRVASDRMARRVIEHSGRYFHVVNVAEPSEVDEELLDWIAEAWSVDE